MREVNEFVINFIGWMIVCIIIGVIHLELFKYNDVNSILEDSHYFGERDFVLVHTEWRD